MQQSPDEYLPIRNGLRLDQKKKDWAQEFETPATFRLGPPWAASTGPTSNKKQMRVMQMISQYLGD